MFLRTRSDGAPAVFALLSIWICVIITTVARPENALETIAGTDPSLVLILDPGHGGLDGGAVSVTGTCESRINWEIASRCFELARFCGIPVVRTRQSFDIDYPQELKSIAACKKWDTRVRTALVNDTPGAVLLSIHQNYYPAAGPHGIQVLYAPDERSRRLAQTLQTALSTLQSDERRTAVPSGREIYLLNHVDGPAVLVECGFLSNPEEAALLETEEYQKKLGLMMIREFYRIRE